MAAYDPNKKKAMLWAIFINGYSFEYGAEISALGNKLIQHLKGARIGHVTFAKDLGCDFLSQEQEQAILLALTLPGKNHFSSAVAAEILKTDVALVERFLQEITEEIGYNKES